MQLRQAPSCLHLRDTAAVLARMGSVGPLCSTQPSPTQWWFDYFNVKMMQNAQRRDCVGDAYWDHWGLTTVRELPQGELPRTGLGADLRLHQWHGAPPAPREPRRKARKTQSSIRGYPAKRPKAQELTGSIDSCSGRLTS